MKTFSKFFPFLSGYRIVRIRKRRRGALGGPKRSYQKYKEAARTLIHARLAKLNEHYRHTWGKVAVRNQRSRWGSCSQKGNMNFNYRLLFLPEPIQDYIIVHELCHLKTFDHSRAFWALVAETIPDHPSRRRHLRRLTKSLHPTTISHPTTPASFAHSYE